MDIPNYLRSSEKFNEWMIIIKKHLEEGDF